MHLSVLRTASPVVIGAVTALLFCASVSATAAAAVAARVNGTEVSTERLDRTFASYLDQQGVGAPALAKLELYRGLRKQVLDTLIAQELLWQHAKSKDIVAADDAVDQVLDQIKSGLSTEAYEHRLRQVGLDEASYREDLKHRMSVEKMVDTEIKAGVEVSDAEIHEFYTANPDSFTRPAEAHLRHILIRVEEGADAAAKEQAREAAEAVLAKAKAPDADFAALAKEYSQDTSAAEGGDLGFVQAAAVVKPFSEAAFALQPGAVSDLVETQFGYHIIKMEERRGGDLVPEDEVRERVRQHLVDQKAQQILQDLLKDLREQGKVELLESL